MTDSTKEKTSPTSEDIAEVKFVCLTLEERRRLAKVLSEAMERNMARFSPYFVDYVEQYQEQTNKDLEILKILGRKKEEITKQAQETYDKHATQEKETTQKTD